MTAVAGNNRCTFQAYGNETVKQSPLSCNLPRNSDETLSLKCLANRVLSRNTPCNTLETKPLNDETGHETPDPHIFEERAAIIECDGVPREWAEGFATLCTMPRPAAYTQKRWEQIINDGGLFLDQWKRQVVALGWQAVDVFGVCPDAPVMRLDAMGLVPLLEGRRVVAITADTARIICVDGAALTYYRRQAVQGAIALWKLGGA